MNSTRFEDQKYQSTLPCKPWYDDGNIILQTEGGTAFRVHQSTLTESSIALDGMIKELDSTKAPLFNGCPILYLQESSLLVRDVIEACYSRSLSPRLKPPTFDVVAVMLHLGKKYGYDT
ncbi:hypothetical protein BDZ94DRAFT_1237076 [Collybia nuda]|uniref:BTB domain-containing protein n=1 Tax=Collybia nuda TaxID=64659 RepID=A0A9P5Y4T7_9AGAR|nr:hypothetical protein BDZ94DRAFT_1237076 [Collybia nuda]